MNIHVTFNITLDVGWHTSMYHTALNTEISVFQSELSQKG